MRLTPRLTPDLGDRPGWKMGGHNANIPLLFLEGRKPNGWISEGDSWAIHLYTPNGYGDAISYLRELAQAATELADQLEQMDAASLGPAHGDPLEDD